MQFRTRVSNRMYCCTYIIISAINDVCFRVHFKLEKVLTRRSNIIIRQENRLRIVLVAVKIKYKNRLLKIRSSATAAVI